MTKTTPRRFAVIGWAWVVLGVLMTLGAGGGLAAWASLQQAHPLSDGELRNIPPMVAMLPYLAPGQALVGVMGAVAGHKYRAGVEWARQLLLVLTTLLLLFMGWMYVTTVLQFPGMPPAMWAMIGVNALVFLTPLALMLRHLAMGPEPEGG